MSCEYCTGWMINATAAFINCPPDGEKTVDILFSFCPMCGAPLTDPQPLALAELREMDGEPVWVEASPDAEEPEEKAWMIVDVPNRRCEGIELVADFNEFGEAWFAYRHPPKEVAT